MVHAAATCGPLAPMRRVVTLPAMVASVKTDVGVVMCTDCTVFSTPPMAAGQVHLFVLA